MIKYIHRAGGVLLFAFLLFCFFQPKTAFASEAANATEITHVTDGAAIFSDTERGELEARCVAVSEENNMDVIILTITGTNLTRKQYLENYYDSQDMVLSDAVLLLLNMDPDNRGIEIQGYGDCEFSVSDDRVELIIDDIYSYLKDGSYYNAMQLFLGDVDYYVNLAPTSTYQHTEQDNQNYNENYYDLQHANKQVNVVRVSLINLLIAVAIGGVVVFIMAYNSGGRMTANQSAYLDASHSSILGKYDRYIRTTTTRRQKPKPPSDTGSGFSGGGGVSSGGHSHSGGGRSF